MQDCMHADAQVEQPERRRISAVLKGRGGAGARDDERVGRRDVDPRAGASRRVHHKVEDRPRPLVVARVRRARRVVAALPAAGQP